MKNSARVPLILMILLMAAMLALPANAGRFSSPVEAGAPLDAKAFYNRGTASYAEGDFAAAVEDLSKSISIEPKAPDAYFNRGLSYRRQNKLDEAVSDFTAAIRLYSFHPSYYLSRANARIVRGEYAAAVEDASHAVNLIPDEARGYFMRGLAHMLGGELDEALEDAILALQLDPFYPDAQRLLQEIIVKKQLLPAPPAFPIARPNTYITSVPKEI